MEVGGHFSLPFLSVETSRCFIWSMGQCVNREVHCKQRHQLVFSLISKLLRYDTTDWFVNLWSLVLKFAMNFFGEPVVFAGAFHYVLSPPLLMPLSFQQKVTCEDRGLGAEMRNPWLSGDISCIWDLWACFFLLFPSCSLLLWNPNYKLRNHLMIFKGFIG